MILRDVHEVYSPRPLDSYLKSNIETEKDRRRKISGTHEAEPKGWSVRQRRMTQMMVRGDNVVGVCKASDERNVLKSRYSRSTATQT